jgi:hypothetical protein
MQGEYISGYLITHGGGPSHPIQPTPPVDPGYGVEGPVDPGYGVPLPPVVDNSLPPQIDNSLPPTYPVDPGYGIPIVPGVWPKPPVHVWPPPQPIYPSHPIYPTEFPEHPIAPGGGPAHPIVLPPGSVWPPLPPAIQGKVLCFVWIVGVGYRWTVIDPSLKLDIGLPGDQPGPGHDLPPHPPDGPPAVPGKR